MRHTTLIATTLLTTAVALAPTPGFARQDHVEVSEHCIATPEALTREAELRGYEVEFRDREHAQESEEIAKRDHARKIGDHDQERKHDHKAKEHARHAVDHDHEAGDHDSKTMQLASGIIPADAVACLTPDGKAGFLPAPAVDIASRAARKALRELHGK